MSIDKIQSLNFAHEEAARYAVLRRLAPTLRHHMVGEFQPLGMMAALLERRLQQRADPDSLVEQCHAMGQLSRQAAANCVALMGWVAPRRDDDMTLGVAVAECINILVTGLRFRGFSISHACNADELRVSGNALRAVLPAAMLYMSDSADGPGDLQVKAQAEGQGAVIDITIAPADRHVEPAPASEYRPVSWGDVCILAQAESMTLARRPGALQLRLAARSF